LWRHPARFPQNTLLSFQIFSSTRNTISTPPQVHPSPSFARFCESRISSITYFLQSAGPSNQSNCQVVSQVACCKDGKQNIANHFTCWFLSTRTVSFNLFVTFHLPALAVSFFFNFRVRKRREKWKKR